MATNRPTSLATPKGLARFPKLVTPDDYKGKLSYKVDLVFDPKDPKVQKFIDTLTGIQQEALKTYTAEQEAKIAEAKAEKKGAAAKKIEEALAALEIPAFVKQEIDHETGDETGRVYVSFKTNALDRDGNPRALKFFDATPKAFKPSGDIGFGAELVVNCTPVCQVVQNKLFLTNYINGVQVLSMGKVGAAGATADAMGFGAAEGFQADDGGFEPSESDDASDY